MIFGKLDVVGNSIVTYGSTYLLSNITTISVRRPLLSIGLIIGTLILGFGISFWDLLRPAEIVIIIAIAASCITVGFWLAQLQLLSRDLRGTELSFAAWGSYRSLNLKRRKIADALNNTMRDDHNVRDDK